MRASALAIVLLLAACGPKNAPRTMHYAQLTLTGALVGVLASSIAAAATKGDTKTAMIGVDIGFGGIALASLGVYLIADVTDVPPPTQSAQQKADEEAWSMTKRAQEAARKGDCDRVKKIEPTVKDRDPSFHDTVFMRDAAIQRCLTGH